MRNVRLTELKEMTVEIRKKVNLVELEFKSLEQETTRSEQSVLTLLFFGITVAAIVNLFTNAVHEQFKDKDFYLEILAVILAALFIIGRYLLVQFYVEPFTKERKRLLKELKSSREQLKSISKDLSDFPSKR